MLAVKEDYQVEYQATRGNKGEYYRLPKALEGKLLEGDALTRFVDSYVVKGIEWLKQRILSAANNKQNAEQYVAEMTARLEAGDYSEMEKYCFYVKTLVSGEPQERAFFHIHVDSQEPLPMRATLALIGAGITYDLFDPAFHVYGADGDLSKPFHSFPPIQHMTLATRSYKEYIDCWAIVTNVIGESGAKCYTEGEYIPYDEPLKCKPFDVDAYNALVPLFSGDTEFKFKSAVSGEYREVPALVKLRRLQPKAVDPKTGRKDPAFRTGEMHLTIRSDSDPRILELMGNLGFSSPGIPKLIEAEGGVLEQNADGSLKEVTEIPFTLQTLKMEVVQKVANLAVYLCEEIGGVTSGSWKLEIAPHFAVQGGVDYNTHVPPVIDSLEIHPYFAGLPDGQIGGLKVDLSKANKAIMDIARGEGVVTDDGKRAEWHQQLFLETMKKDAIPYDQLIAGTVVERRIKGQFIVGDLKTINKIDPKHDAKVYQLKEIANDTSEVFEQAG